jgi:hypothetical protein
MSTLQFNIDTTNNITQGSKVIIKEKITIIGKGTMPINIVADMENVPKEYYKEFIDYFYKIYGGNK